MNNITSVANSHNYIPQQSSPGVSGGKAAVSNDTVSIGGGDLPCTDTAGLKKWTLLVYSAADNDLEPELVNDVIELEGVGSGDSVNILCQLDRGVAPSSISGGWAGCRRYYLNSGNDSSRISSPVMSDLGQVKMSDPGVLADFVEWGIKNYPAENYMLVVASHGKGWFGVAPDKSHGGWMHPPHIREALETAQTATGEKIDVIGFDACCMASTEVASELSGVADFMVASQNSVGGEGWPYAKIFSGGLSGAKKQRRPVFEMSPKNAALEIVARTKNTPGIQTMSALDLSKAGALATAADEFAGNLMENDSSAQAIMDIAAKTKTFNVYKDQYDFAEKVFKSNDVDDGKLKKSAAKIADSVKNIVMSHHRVAGFEGANGISVDISDRNDMSDFRKDVYKGLNFSRQTKWDQALSHASALKKSEKTDSH